MTDAPTGLRLQVSGNPTPEELAAVIAVVDHVAAQSAASRRRPEVPAWVRAARLEGVGRPVRTRADLEAP